MAWLRSEGAEFDITRSWASLPVFALRATPRQAGKSGAVFSGAGEVGGGRARVVLDSVASLVSGKRHAEHHSKFLDEADFFDPVGS